MNEWKVVDQDTGDVWHKDSRTEAENAIEEFGDVKNLTIEAPTGEEKAHVTEDNTVVQQGAKSSDGGVEVVEESPDEEIHDNPSVADDPIDWVPSHFVDEIQGVPAINRKGYAVLAEQYEIEVTREFVTYPSDTDFEYAEAEATAVTRDGREYSGFGSASIERDDDPTLLGELAETRAIKRSLALATGVGMTAVSELKNEL